MHAILLAITVAVECKEVAMQYIKALIATISIMVCSSCYASNDAVVMNVPQSNNLKVNIQNVDNGIRYPVRNVKHHHHHKKAICKKYNNFKCTI